MTTTDTPFAPPLPPLADDSLARHPLSVEGGLRRRFYGSDPVADKRLQDIFATLYLVASLYTTGYSMVRPAPGGWGAALGDVLGKMSAIQQAVGALGDSIRQVQDAIKNLPAVMNAIVETQFIEQLFRASNARAEQLSVFMRDENTLSANVGEVERIGNDLITDLIGISDWYRKNPNGPLSYVMVMAPLVSVASQSFNLVQVRKWADKNPQHVGPYPFKDILNITAYSFLKTVQQAYGTVIDTTRNALTQHGPDAARTFPWNFPRPEDTSAPAFHYYRFDNGGFTLAMSSSSAVLEPRRSNEELFLGSWAPPAQGKTEPDVGLLMTQFRKQLYQCMDATMSGGFPPASMEPYASAKAAAMKIARAQYEVDRYRLVAHDLEKHEQVLQVISRGQVWSST
jgi:hypothetical protein